MKKPEDVAVIHLVRLGNKLEAFEDFLNSYRAHPAGTSHRLVILLKGFEKGIPTEVASLLNTVPHTRILCPDYGYDIGSYYYATERVRNSILLFMNSYSVILGHEWLSKMLAAFNMPKVKLVGASGSWQSKSTSCYYQALAPSSSALEYGIAKLRIGVSTIPRLALFPRFPNMHLRTNAFMIQREQFLLARPLLMRSKVNAYLFESGYNSLTRRVAKRGGEVVVVGRNGAVYWPEQWANSGTFWQGDQENLLIQDNQTKNYHDGGAELRRHRQWCAWNCKFRWDGLNPG